MGFLDLLLGLVLLAVIGVLLFGVVSMARGGEASKKYSNKMMRWRVVLQLVAVVVIAAVLFARGGGGG